jgi:hypothetical protein
VVLAGTWNSGGGVYRSTDGGASFIKISGASGSGLPDSYVSSLIYDPLHGVAYAGLPGYGVYRSLDNGLTWGATNLGIVDPADSGARVELAVHADPSDGSDAIYAALLHDEPSLRMMVTDVYRSTDDGQSWMAMDRPGTNEGGQFVGTNPGEEEEDEFEGNPEPGQTDEPGGQGSIHFAMVADPHNPFVVYVSGDRQPAPFPNSIGANNYSGRAFKGDASGAPGSQWVPVTNDGADPDGPGGPQPGTSPHADSRDMVFDANGNILQGNDGGLYRLVNPGSDAPASGRMWTAAMGNIRNTEYHSIAYDSVTHTLFGGAQDVGTSMQDGVGSPYWFQWIQGDGGKVAVDTTTDPRGYSIRYTSYQYMGFFNRSYWDASGINHGTEAVPLVVNGTGGLNIFQVDSIGFYQPFVLNKVAQNRMVLGTTSLYESTDRGNTLNRLGGGLNGNGYYGTVYAYDAGGRKAGVANPDAMYVSTYDWNTFTGYMWMRSAPGNALTNVTAAYNAAGGFVASHLVIDPQDWRRAYATDFNGHVYATFNGGGRWLDITGDLYSAMPSTADMRTIEIVSPTSSVSDDILLIGGFGGVFAVRHPGMAGQPIHWVPLGAGLSDAPVNDLHYDATDDVVVIGTLGRGAWTLSDPNAALSDAGSPRIRMGLRARVAPPVPGVVTPPDVLPPPPSDFGRSAPRSSGDVHEDRIGKAGLDSIAVANDVALSEFLAQGDPLRRRRNASVQFLA